MFYLAGITLLLVNIAAHELGHCLAARFLGYSVQLVQLGFGWKIASFAYPPDVRWYICLLPLGGRISVDYGSTVRFAVLKQSVVVLCGPLANVVLAIAFYATAVLFSQYDFAMFFSGIGDPGWICLFGAVCSLNFGLLNLLPVPPLDGGVLCFLILQALRRKALPQQSEVLITSLGGYVLAASTALLFGGFLWLIVR